MSRMSLITTQSYRGILRWDKKADSKSQGSKKDSIIKSLISRPKDFGSHNESGSNPLFKSGKLPSQELPSNTFQMYDLSRNPNPQFEKKGQSKANYSNSHSTQTGMNTDSSAKVDFQYKGQVYNDEKTEEQAFEDYGNGSSEFNGGLTTNFLNYQNESTSTMNNLMPYEIVATSDNEEDDGQSDEDDSHDFESKKASLHQTLEDRRFRMLSNKNV
jgi:hypothetical protein